MRFTLSLLDPPLPPPRTHAPALLTRSSVYPLADVRERAGGSQRIVPRAGSPGHCGAVAVLVGKGEGFRSHPFVSLIG